MTTQPDDGTTSPTEEFESALQTLVLESFAAGVTVSGTWDVACHSEVVPNWRITIEKTDRSTLPDNEVFLDE